MKKYDAVIIGAGQSGMPLARQISGKGLKVALIEEGEIGGTCINAGCSPTKTMVASAKVAYQVSRASDFGVKVQGYTVDQKSVKKRKDYIIDLFRGGAESGLKKAENVDIIKGRGTFESDKEIKVQPAKGKPFTIGADKLFINTGSETIIPPIEGLRDAPYLTSTTVMDLEETPDHLLILGGGYIGLEFAQMFRRFGSKITIIDSASRLVKKEDEDVCQEICDIFNRTKINTIFNASVQKVKEKDGKISLFYEVDKEDHQITGSHLLVSVGRAPSSKNLGLESIGVELTNSGHVKVNGTFETSVKDIYALGDVGGSASFRYIAYHDGKLGFDHVYEKKEISKGDRFTPYCIFIDPQLARIGLNEQQAKEKEIPFQVGKFWMKHAGRPLETDEKDGFFKILVDPKTKKILGATILSMDGGEILAVIQMAMLGGITYDTIQSLPIAHPTLAESLNNLMMAVK